MNITTTSLFSKEEDALYFAAINFGIILWLHHRLSKALILLV
jgi:hypothetical protein